jgi:hypothetical protein
LSTQNYSEEKAKNYARVRKNISQDGDCLKEAYELKKRGRNEDKKQLLIV